MGQEMGIHIHTQKVARLITVWIRLIFRLCFTSLCCLRCICLPLLMYLCALFISATPPWQLSYFNGEQLCWPQWAREDPPSVLMHALLTLAQLSTRVIKHRGNKQPTAARSHSQIHAHAAQTGCDTLVPGSWLVGLYPNQWDNSSEI